MHARFVRAERSTPTMTVAVLDTIYKILLARDASAARKCKTGAVAANIAAVAGGGNDEREAAVIKVRII